MNTEPGLAPDVEATPETVDVLGIGFGPSNLALALAIEEHNAAVSPGERLRARFVEQQAQFGWHRGMLLEGATMQVSFLKDLVTMRDPTSPRSFLAYLHDKGRLADFINNKSLFPSRVEFHDYLEWTATDVEHLVDYDTRAVAVHPVRPRSDGDVGGRGDDGDHTEQGAVTELDVVLRDVTSGDRRVVRARNLVLATGLVPSLPAGVERGPRVWHNSELLHRLRTLDEGAPDTVPARPPRRFLVVGAGQSAAETTEYLHSRFPEAEVRAVFSRYGYSPADDTSFANRIFDPDAVDHFFVASDDVKQMLLDYHGNTNYSVVDQELIAELYRRAYQEKVLGRVRLHVHSACRVAAVRPPAGPDGGTEVDIEFLPTGVRETVETDVVVYATGYRPIDPSGLLGDVGGWCSRSDNGELFVERDYRLHTVAPLRAGVYLQGPTEHTHGISSTLLSTTAVRAGEIVSSVVTARRPAPEIEVVHDHAGEPATIHTTEPVARVAPAAVGHDLAR